MLNAFVAKAAEPQHSLLIPAIPDLVWGSLAFIIVLVLFVWKVVPRLNQALDARIDAIEGGLKRAEEAQAGAQEALDSYNEQLAEARAEAARIREQAREDAKKIRAELVEAANAEAARITEQGKAAIEAERRSALVSLRAEVGSLAIDLASGVIGESLSDDARSTAIVDRFLADLEIADRAGEVGREKAKA
jgi:F-type H+-transporting ATPase subunit b